MTDHGFGSPSQPENKLGTCVGTQDTEDLEGWGKKITAWQDLIKTSFLPHFPSCMRMHTCTAMHHKKESKKLKIDHDINLRAKTIKLRRKLGASLHNIRNSSEFLNVIPNSHMTKVKNKLDIIKI